MIQLKIRINKDDRELINNIEDYLSIRNIDELENCCDLLCHMKKNHEDKVSDDELYDLAKIIKLNFPDSRIDWINTFVQIESSNYLNALEGNQDNDVECNVFDNIEDVLNTENEVETQTASDQLRKIVSEKLYKKEII